MQPEDRPEFIEHLEGLCASFGKEADKALLHGYWMGLEDMPLEALTTACRRALRECQFMPKPFELRKMGGELDGGTRAVRAWGELEFALRTCGAYRSVDFEDPAINAVVRTLGGWVYLCKQEAEELNKFIQPRFVRAYEGFFAHGVSGDAGRYLPGISETENQAHGFEVEPPRVIASGDPLPRRLLESGRDRAAIGEVGLGALKKLVSAP